MLYSVYTFQDFTTVASGNPDVPWDTPKNAQTSDNVYSRAGLTNDVVGKSFSQYLFCKKKTGADAIPTNCRITGISVSVERKGTVVSRNGINDKTIQLLDDTGTRAGTNKAVSTLWPSTDGTATYGGIADKWGLALTPTIVNSLSFGIAIQAKLSSALFPGGYVAEIDYVSMTIYFRHAFLPLLGVI